MKWDPLEMTLYRRVAGRYWCNNTPHNVEGGVVYLTCVSWQNGATLLCTSIGEICLATGISNLFQGHNQRVLTQTARCLKVAARIMIVSLITFGFILSISSFISCSSMSVHSVNWSKKSLCRVCEMAHHNFHSLRVDALSACDVVWLGNVRQLISETSSV